MESAAAPSPLEQGIRRLRELQRAGRHAEALAAVPDWLRAAPDDRELLLIRAVGLRNLGRVPEALAALEDLERREPRFSRLHQERGLCYVALNDTPRAVAAFERAVAINAALPASWEMLERLYRAAAEHAQAAEAADHLGVLKRLPLEMVAATSLFCDGDLAAAERIVRGVIARQGEHPEALRLLARIALAQDAPDDAQTLLEKVLRLAPDHHAARRDYADLLMRQNKYAPAQAEIDRLLAREPANRDYRLLAATIAAGASRHDRAAAIYRDMIRDGQDSPEVQVWLGHALKTLGAADEAVAAYRAAVAARPDFGDAYWSLANLKTYRFDDGEIARMRRADAAPATAPADRPPLCFALGKALEDRGAFAESWTFYSRGNALMRAERPYRQGALDAALAAQEAICTPAFFAARAGWGAPARDPIFIVGMPRSGSTLIEQILASHSQVDGTQELPDVPGIVHALQRRGGFPAVLAALTPADVGGLGERYLADTRSHRAGRPYFIDKMPNNFRHVGLIHLMLPNARIIDARREPLACCLGNLKQLYASGQEFAYGIEDVAHYYRTYLAFMRHWQRALPGRVLRVQHEDLVADPDGSIRRLLDHCGLDFEPACLDFHRTRRSIATPSAEQVRQPIDRERLEDWKAYEAWLDPLKTGLGDATSRYRE